MQRYVLSILSALLLIGAVYPFYLWPLAFVALAPFFYFSSDQSRSLRELCIGAGSTGFIFGFFLMCNSLFRLHIELSLPIFYFFTYLCGILSVFFIALSFVALGLSYQKLRTRLFFLNTLLGATLYTLLEIVLQKIGSGYYYGSLAHAVPTFQPIMLYASIGGEFFVSFIVALCSVTIAEIWRSKKNHGYYPVYGNAFLFILVCAIGAVAHSYKTPLSAPVPMTVAIVQFTNEQWRTTSYGKKINGVFSAPLVESFITAAATNKTSLVLYPYGVASRVFEEQALAQLPPTFTDRNAVGAWFQTLVPTTTTVVAWDNFQKDSATYSELVYWRAGVESVYQKRELHPFSDYMPKWLQKIGFTESPHAYVAGDYQNQATVNGVTVGSVICSEVETPTLARYDASRSSFLISIGSDAIFPGAMSGNYSLASARYRAAENNISVVRGNIIGPSAIINPDGSIQTLLSYDTAGILRGTVSTTKNKTTLFGRFDSIPLYLLLAGVLLLAVGLKLKRS